MKLRQQAVWSALFCGCTLATWAPIENLEINLSGAWLHARYKTFANATANGFNATTQMNVPNQRQDWSGHEMARAPAFSAALGASYTIPQVFGGDLEATANLKYTDSYVLNNPSLFGPLAPGPPPTCSATARAPTPWSMRRSTGPTRTTGTSSASDKAPAACATGALVRPVQPAKWASASALSTRGASGRNTGAIQRSASRCGSAGRTCPRLASPAASSSSSTSRA